MPKTFTVAIGPSIKVNAYITAHTFSYMFLWKKLMCLKNGVLSLTQPKIGNHASQSALIWYHTMYTYVKNLWLGSNIVVMLRSDHSFCHFRPQHYFNVGTQPHRTFSLTDCHTSRVYLNTIAGHGTSLPVTGQCTMYEQYDMERSQYIIGGSQFFSPRSHHIVCCTTSSF